MAILYYPKNQILARRDATNPAYEQLDLGMLPNTIIYFDTASAMTLSSSALYITSSWAQTASVTLLFSSNSLSSSYAETASFAMNGGGGGGAVGAASWSFYQFPVQSAKLAATKSALLNNGTYNWELLFRQEESAVWQMRMPVGFSGSLVNTFQWYPTASNAGAKQVLWNIYLWHWGVGENTSSLPSTVFGITSSFQQSGSVIQQTTVWLTGSPITASDFLVYKLERGTGSQDTAVGPIAVISTTFDWIKG